MPSRFFLRAGVAVFATVLVSLCICFGMILGTGKVRVQQGDFLVYYSAAHLVLGGHGSAIYHFSSLKAVERSMFHSLLLIRNEAVFLYPPFVALLFAPLAGAGYATAYVLWMGVNLAVFGGTLLVLCRYLAGSRGHDVLFGLAATSFFPVFAAVVQGQISIVLLGSLTASFMALRSGRAGLGGALLALVLIKPPYVLPFLLLIVVQRRWRSLLAFAGTSAILVALPTLTLGASIDRDYVALLREAMGWHTTSGGFSAIANQNLSGFCRSILSAPTATTVQIACSLIALAGVWFVAARVSSVDSPFAVATIVALLVNPHVLIHDLSLLIIPAAIMVHLTSGARRSLLVVLIAAYVAALAGTPLQGVIHFQLTVPAMLGMLCWLGAYGIRQSGRLEEAPAMWVSEGWNGRTAAPAP